MKKRFFNPYVGINYETGINGKKILVVGASFYCPNLKCAFFKQCTNLKAKDSSKFNKICPIYAPLAQKLCNEPSYCIEDMPETYVTFAKAMARYTGTEDYHTNWNMLAFTNYVQFFLPSDGESCRQTYVTDLSERDYESFNETLVELQPDIVIIWGCVFNSRLKERNKYLVSKEELEDTDWYICHIQVPGVDSPITLINSYHPSFMPTWKMGLDDFYKYMDMILPKKETEE